MTIARIFPRQGRARPLVRCLQKSTENLRRKVAPIANTILLSLSETANSFFHSNHYSISTFYFSHIHLSPLIEDTTTSEGTLPTNQPLINGLSSFSLSLLNFLVTGGGCFSPRKIDEVVPVSKTRALLPQVLFVGQQELNPEVSSNISINHLNFLFSNNEMLGQWYFKSKLVTWSPC